MQEDDGNVGALNASALHVLKQHYGIGVDKQKASRKRGRKVVPSQGNVSLDTEDAPGSSKENANIFSRKKENHERK